MRGICILREGGIYRQAGLCTYWQKESLAGQKLRGICILIVGKGAYTDRQAYLLAGRESFSSKMERELHML